MPADLSPIQEGTVIADKYKVERVLGAGGMGVVVLARHLVLDERVALKFLRPEAGVNLEAIGRFIREARATTRLKSEHVARVSDVGQLPDGAPYMVMEFLDGVDLATWVQKRGALPTDQAVDFTLQACEALAEAHWRGIVHRDLKPANLFCISRPDGTPCIKVLDFGISKVSNEDHKLTKTTAILGSPVYMSPEQMRRSHDVDARTDIWSLGVILFELLTGRAPFNAETVPELVLKVATEPPPPLRTVIPDASPLLEAILTRCLEKDRGQRFGNVGELAVALQDFGTSAARSSTATILRMLARDPGVSTTTLETVAVRPAEPETLRTAQTYVTDRTSPGSRRWAIVGACGGLAIVTIATLAFVATGDGPGARSVAAPPPPSTASAVPAPVSSPAPLLPVDSVAAPIPPAPPTTASPSPSAAPPPIHAATHPASPHPRPPPPGPNDRLGL